MKKVLLVLLGLILLFGVLGAAGYTGYRFGYMQGAQVSANGDSMPHMGPDRMPMHNFGFDRDFHRGFGMHGSPMMGRGFFSPLMWLGQIALWVLIGLAIYWLFTRSGWQLTRTVRTTEPQPKAVNTEAEE